MVMETIFQIYSGISGKCSIHGVDNVGTVPAALTAYLAIQEFKPDIVISLGTAGGFKAKGAQIGDVYVSSGFANHDRHIPIPARLYSFFSYHASVNWTCFGKTSLNVACQIFVVNSKSVTDNKQSSFSGEK